MLSGKHAGAERMEWYWVALILGVIAPWIVMGRQIRIGFEEGGLLTGLGTWFGVCVITVPIVLLISWVVRLFVG